MLSHPSLSSWLNPVALLTHSNLSLRNYRCISCISLAGLLMDYPYIIKYTVRRLFTVYIPNFIHPTTAVVAGNTDRPPFVDPPLGVASLTDPYVDPYLRIHLIKCRAPHTTIILTSSALPKRSATGYRDSLSTDSINNSITRSFSATPSQLLLRNG